MGNKGSDSSDNKKKKKNKNIYTIIKFIVILVLILIIVTATVVGATVYAWISNAKPLNTDEIFNLNQTTYILDSNAKVIDKVHAYENRSIVTLDVIPKNLQYAFVAIEDKRFFTHNGIDPYRIMGALIEDIKTGKPAQGGSTITQQLIKNIYLTPDKLLKRKVVEMYYALQLERHFTKKQILEAYLNTIALGHNIGGVQEASLFYFGKNVQDLNLAEAAIIAGITKNPSAYSPYLNFESSNKRKELILKEMLEQNYISQDEYENALNETIKLTKIEKEVETTYFSDMVIKDAISALQQNLELTQEEAELMIFNGGLKIISTIDTDIQNIIEKQFQNEKLFPQSIEESNGVVQPQAAFVVIDYKTGQIRGIMGGRTNKVKRGLNRATQSLRQPGSSIKPLAVYSPALDNGYTVATVIDDSEFILGSHNFLNYDRKYRGLVTIREAIKHSLNVVAVKIVQDIGIDRSIEYLKKFGITTLELENRSRNDKGLSPLALGGLTKGVKPIEMASAYGTFPNKGIHINPISFTQILDKDGNVILENKPQKNKVLSEQVSYLMIDIMKGVVNGGTGGNAALSKMPTAGKTGTTDDKKDAWFVGYTPYYTAAVWMGYDEPKSMNFTGGKYPAMLWKAIMDNIHKDLAYKEFERPNGIINVDICTESGKKPSPLCSLDPRGSTIRSEIFIKGSEPSEENICDTHVIKDIDIETGLLAGPDCPPSLIQSKVFIQRKEPLKQTQKMPEDAAFEAPTQISPPKELIQEEVTPKDIIEQETGDSISEDLNNNINTETQNTQQ